MRYGMWLDIEVNDGHTGFFFFMIHILAIKCSIYASIPMQLPNLSDSFTTMHAFSIKVF